MRERLHLALLLLVGGIALGLRLAYLVPPERGVLFAADADEGIYATSAQLALQGYAPYRDYFCSAPPGALLLFMAVLAPTSSPWGSTTGYMALRYTSVVYGLITLITVYTIGARLGGRWVGLLAAFILAIDGYAVGQDRRAMLESPMNMFSALAILAWLRRDNARPLRSAGLAGALAGMAALVKTQGSVVILAIALAALAGRDWRRGALMLATAALTYSLVSLPFVLQSPDAFVRQIFFFQVLRPPNGDPAIALRYNAIRSYPEAWLTVRLGLLGALVWMARMAAERMGTIRWQYRTDQWAVIILWAILVAGSFALSRTYYLYYYAQLAVPLALLAGLVVDVQSGRRWQDPTSLGGTKGAGRAVVFLRWLPAALALAMVSLFAPRLLSQAHAVWSMVQWTKPWHAELARSLIQDNVLAFEPNYTFLAGRRLARTPDGMFFVDSHAYMLYINLAIDTRSYQDLLRDVLRHTVGDERSLAQERRAQNAVVGAWHTATMVILDARARYLLAPDTLALIRDTSRPLAMASQGGAEVRLRMP